MKLSVTQGSEVELRDEQGRLVARCYSVYSKTEKDDRGMMKQDLSGLAIAHMIADVFNAHPETHTL